MLQALKIAISVKPSFRCQPKTHPPPPPSEGLLKRNIRPAVFVKCFVLLFVRESRHTGRREKQAPR